MRIFLLLLVFSCILQARVHESFNSGWTFFNAEAEGAEKPEFDDSGWRKLDLPHDWAIEGPFDIKYNARSGGLPFHGTGWYRKTFEVPNSSEEKRVSITFDGAMYNAHVWLNGHFLGNRPFGYMGFQYDLSKYLKYGEENVIAVRLRPEDLSSRWYPGAGLYRNTWLTTTEKVYVPLWGHEITTPLVNKKESEVTVVTHVKNETDRALRIIVKTRLVGPDGEEVAMEESPIQLERGERLKCSQAFFVSSPKLWGIKTPHLYTAKTLIEWDGRSLDEIESSFGIRSVKYVAGEGLYLNGELVRLKGVCLHHDLGPLGAAVNRRATERQLQIMQEMGVNSIRTSHNPPSPEQLEFCDKMGILVQVEAFDCWQMAKIPNGYNKFFDEWHERDLRDMVRRDRNHPSVIMWSIGNEILEQGKKDGWKLARKLHRICKDEDPTRLTSAGFNYYPASVNHGLAAEVDIPGFNYKPMAYGEVAANYPDWHILASETSSCTSSRGVYHLPIKKYQKYTDNQVTSYDLIGPGWAYPPDIEFDSLKKNPNVLGEYIWTGFDYLGEPTPYGGRDNSTNGYWNDDWPSRSSYFGAVDLCGLPKDRFYLYQSQWRSVEEKPMVHLLPHWNWEGHEVKIVPVYAYTNGDEAELFLNGKLLGRKKKGSDRTPIDVAFHDWPGYRAGKPAAYSSPYRLSWDVAYETGELKVVAYYKGEKIAEAVQKTAATPARIDLSADQDEISIKDKDLSYVTVRILDESGTLCPTADNLVEFEIQGPGEILAVGNGNAASLESFQAPQRKAFSGKCMVIVSSTGDTGEIILSAKAEGLEKAQVKLLMK